MTAKCFAFARADVYGRVTMARMKKAKAPAPRRTEPLGPLIQQLVRSFSKYHLNYAQTAYVMKLVRKQLGLAPETKPKKLPEVISWDEAEKIIAQAYRLDPVYGLILKFLWITMVRVSELVSLQVDDLHFDDGYAKIRAGKGNKDRLIVVPTALAQELKSQVGHRRRGPIFMSQQRHGFSSRRIEQIASQAARAAKIRTRVTPHTFRRSMATALLNRGVREEVVSTLLGHESTETTRAAYARLSIQTLAQEIDRALTVGTA